MSILCLFKQRDSFLIVWFILSRLQQRFRFATLKFKIPANIGCMT